MGIDIIAIGEPLLEFNSEEEGSLSEVRHFVVGWGGDTSNFSIAASRLGGSVGYLTRLGEDEFAFSFLNLWKKEGIDTSCVTRDSNSFTGIYFIARKGKDHFFTYYRKNSAASRMTPESVPVKYISQAKILHISGISQGISTTACDTVFKAIATAKADGVLISYDPNLRLKLWTLQRAKAIIHQTMTMADFIFLSLEDASELTGMEDPEEIVDFYLNMGPKVVVLKLGADGALLTTRENINGTPPIQAQKFFPYKVKSVDMSGAGDTFDAAFVVGYLSGWGLEKCMRFANAAAALTTTGLGAVTPIPRLRDVEALMAQQKR